MDASLSLVTLDNLIVVVYDMSIKLHTWYTRTIIVWLDTLGISSGQITPSFSPCQLLRVQEPYRISQNQYRK